MAVQPDGSEPWKQEIAELKTAVTEMSAALKTVQPTDLTEIKAALQSLTSELTAIKAAQPDSQAASALVANLERQITKLSEQVAALPRPPKNEGDPPVPPAPPSPPEKQNRRWI